MTGRYGVRGLRLSWKEREVVGLRLISSEELYGRIYFRLVRVHKFLLRATGKRGTLQQALYVAYFVFLYFELSGPCQRSIIVYIVFISLQAFSFSKVHGVMGGAPLPVRCIETGQVFPSGRSAGRIAGTYGTHISRSQAHMEHMIAGTYGTHISRAIKTGGRAGGYRWEYYYGKWPVKRRLDGLPIRLHWFLRNQKPKNVAGFTARSWISPKR
eukprot:g15670.t1